ncbi:TolC family protein [Reichenbachiella versicolor]|uniref:TolC family protein n=1 Tax=Reichenbachiella versicolor TaxID=1821036 RepID=UPI000D6EA64A|nr:TolC family protein [Reichenbachiella versicolor]
MIRNILTAVILTVCLSVQGQESKKWTLEECVQYAIENNISIQQSELDILDAKAGKKTALGNFLPNATGTVNHAWNNGLTRDPITGVNANVTQMNTSVGANARIDLFTGLNNRRQMQRAELSIISNQYQLDDMKDNISLNVASAFLQILFNVENLKVLKYQKEISKQEISRTNELIASGTIPQGDIYEVEATLASQEQQIVIAENDIRLSKINLAQILLITDYENFDVSFDDIEITEAPEVLSAKPKEIYDVALDTRYSIKIQETQLDIAKKNYFIAKSGYSPTLSAFYSFDTRASDRPTLDSNTGQPLDAAPIFDQFSRNKGHTYGFTLSVPIFSRFRNNVNVQRNKLSMQRAQLDYEQTKIDLESNVNQAYNDAKGALKAYHAAEKTAHARSEAFKYAEGRHEVGVINSFEYQQIKQQMEAAESQVIRAKYDYIFKLKILEFYFGIPIAKTTN